MNLCDIAIRYATARPGGVEWAMLPVGANKRPACAHGVHSATTDPDELRAMWAREPDANPAVRCEAFFVVDVDPRNGGDRVLDGWREAGHAIPRSWCASTGSGGLHLYYAHAPELDEIPLGRLVDGIDIKGGGRHYVLVPPAQSRSGPYRWIVRPTSTPLARAPRWLIERIVATKRPPLVIVTPTPDVKRTRRLERATLYAGAMPPAIAGSGGHAMTFRAAMLIARGFALDEDEALSALVGWNRNCQPPWSERELRRKIREALEHGSMPVGMLLAKSRAS